jgi:hypothetical protein
MSTPLNSTESAAGAIAKVRYTHDAMIDLVIANPSISQNEIAKHFGYTVAWVSRIFCSDAFQARLEARKAEIVNPALTASVEERIKGVAMQSLDIIAKKLEATENPDLAVKAFELTAKAAGYGARQDKLAVQNNFVVHLPSKANDPHAWAEAHRPGGGVIDAPVKEVTE